MPYVNVRTVAGALDDADKKELLDRITQALVDIEGGGNPAFRQFVWVSIEEVPGTSWSIGGMQPTAEQIHAFRVAGRTTA